MTQLLSAADLLFGVSQSTQLLRVTLPRTISMARSLGWPSNVLPGGG